jgi:hypothetical protein
MDGTLVAQDDPQMDAFSGSIPGGALFNPEWEALFGVAPIWTQCCAETRDRTGDLQFCSLKLSQLRHLPPGREFEPPRERRCFRPLLD